MDTFKILVEGYMYEGDNGSMFASPTTTYIESNDKKIIVDPGADKPKLLDGMKKEGIKVEDIDMIFLTHWHPDHFLNIRVFPNTDIYDSETIWKDNGEEMFFKDMIPGTNVKILETPGHVKEHVALLLETQDYGTLCVAQDVFWWADGKQKTDNYDELINYNDIFASDLDLLKESRKKVLEIADWIIPGHGKMFKNEFKK